MTARPRKPPASIARCASAARSGGSVPRRKSFVPTVASSGVYAAAAMEIEGRSLGVLNVRVLDEREPLARASLNPRR